MNPRVLMVGPQALGGISTLIQTILPDLGQRVDLLYCPTVRRRPLRESGKISVQNMALAISQYARFVSALHRFRPEIIHIHTSQGLGWLKDSLFVLVARAYRRRIILHVHAADFGELYGKKARLIQRYTRQVMGLADVVIAVSTEWKTRLAEIVPAEHVYALRNCIAVDTALHPPSRPSTNGVKALFLGSIGARKGIFDLLEAMSYSKSHGSSLKLWVAGSEERNGEMARVLTRVEELHLEDVCQFTGYVRGEEKRRLLTEADLFVLPSYHEGLPMAILEALSAGLPIVASAVGGIPEVIKDGCNGYLITPGDVEALAEKLMLLANDPHMCQEMGRHSREIAEQEFKVDTYCERLIALYESLVHSGVKPDSPGVPSVSFGIGNR
jgi:glycosyltransferase involved in cell wall biosynthesis